MITRKELIDGIRWSIKQAFQNFVLDMPAAIYKAFTFFLFSAAIVAPVVLAVKFLRGW